MSNSLTSYSGRIQDRKMHESAIALRTWLAAPITRLMMPRKKRVQIQALITHLAERLSPVEHLTYTPPVGVGVRLLSYSPYLRERFGAVVGSIGLVVGYSRLSRDDDGVLVDWGNGAGQVRCSLHELAMAPEPVIPLLPVTTSFMPERAESELATA